MNLSEHFTLDEMTASQTATRRGIGNTPSPTVIDNLKRLAATLEHVRSIVNGPIHVSSGYRCAALNIAIGGASSSMHVRGLAADITAAGMTAKELALAIMHDGIAFDQLIYEGTWVHIGLAVGEPRNQILTATFNNGKATYSEGIT